MPTTTPNPLRNDHSAGWAFQTKLSFAIATTGLVLGLVYLPVDPWARAFLASTSLFAIASAINLSKAVRDEHEASRVVSRIDEVKLEKILAEHDPFRAA